MKPNIFNKDSKLKPRDLFSELIQKQQWDKSFKTFEKLFTELKNELFPKLALDNLEKLCNEIECI